MATMFILGLYPLFRAGVVDTTIPTVIECKTGSSGSGGAPGLGSHHPERSGAMRSFKPTGHRHTAEIIQECTFGMSFRHLLLGNCDRGGSRAPRDLARLPEKKR